MPSLLKATGPFLFSFADLVLILLFLGASSVHGASLREHRPREESQRRGVLQAPSADMLKALEYMESLHQRTDVASSAGYDESNVDDAEKLRGLVLRLAADPMQSSDEEEEEEEGGQDKSKELLQAVFSTLEQTEGGAFNRKLPLMFDDEEEGEGDEEEEHENSFKRTNENVEEKYTPQNLATLQSVFDELDKLTSTKEGGDTEEDYDEEEEDDGMFNVRNVVYDDTEADWGPLQEQEEEEEDRRDRKYEADDDDEEEDDESYLVKRSKDADDFANLVDYYLLRRLEEREEEEQKREEEERKRTAQYRDMEPQDIYQLIHISQKYQVPPEDLLDMLQTGDTDKDQEARTPKRLFRAEDMTSKQKSPEAETFNRKEDETLNFLGSGGDRKQKKYKSLSPRLQSLGRTGDAMQRLPAGVSRGDYDDSEDELAAYLAAQMLAQQPKLHRDNKTSQKQDGDGQNMTGSLEQTHRDKKRQSEDEDMQVQDFDKEPLLKLLSYLKPQSQDIGT